MVKGCYEKADSINVQATRHKNGFLLLFFLPMTCVSCIEFHSMNSNQVFNLCLQPMSLLLEHGT